MVGADLDRSRGILAIRQSDSLLSILLSSLFSVDCLWTRSLVFVEYTSLRTGRYSGKILFLVTQPDLILSDTKQIS